MVDDLAEEADVSPGVASDALNQFWIVLSRKKSQIESRKSIFDAYCVKILEVND